MAILEGAIKFRGSVGTLRSYKDSDTGEQILSTKRGKNPKCYKNRKSAARVKELNREFQGLNVWAKSILIGTENLSYLKKGRIHGKLVSIAKRIQQMPAEGIRGRRSIESSKFNYPLIGFCMNNAHPFQTVCHVEPEISITDDRREVTLRLTNFVSWLKFKWTERIDYYRVYLNIFELPDVVWDTNDRKYHTVYPGISLAVKTTVSDWIKVSPDRIDFQISAAFDENQFPREKSTVLVSVGFEFASGMQYNTPYVVKGNGTMAIVGCY